MILIHKGDLQSPDTPIIVIQNDADEVIKCNLAWYKNSYLHVDENSKLVKLRLLYIPHPMSNKTWAGKNFQSSIEKLTMLNQKYDFILLQEYTNSKKQSPFRHFNLRLRDKLNV